MHTTQQNLDIVITAWKVLLNLVFGDESGTASPTGRGVVEHVVDGEPGGVSGSQLIQFSLEQDILWVDVGIDKADLGLILGVLESGTDDLEHGSDSSSSGDHSKLTRQVWGIDEFALGALDFELVSNLEEGHMTRDVALLIGLTMVWYDVGRTKAAHTLISRSKWPRLSSLLVGV